MTPTAADLAGLLVGVPVVAAVAPLLIGIAAFVAGLAVTTPKSIGAAAYPGLLVIMIGLVVAGPWLTAQAARLVGLFTREPSALLATRRLADNPKGAFRAVRGLVLAVFLGTIAAPP